MNKIIQFFTKSKLGIALIVSAIAILFFLISPPFTWSDGNFTWADWTGFSSGTETKTVTEQIEENGKTTILKHIITEEPDSGTTLIDWINTLIAPFSLTILGFWFQQQQEKRAEEQAEVDKEIADNNLCEEALQAYFDRLSELLLNKKLTVLTPDDPVQEVALNVIRARTLSILRRIGEDKERKGNIARFLIDSELMSKLNLSDADLRSADLVSTNLENTNFRNADLENADLRDADLTGAKLENANLTNADLTGAKLENADLKDANLTGANLTGAKLQNANLRNTQLKDANLTDARLENSNLRNSELENANLTDARLDNAILIETNFAKSKLERTNLLNANLEDAKLKNANLLEANLAGANLSGADLRGAINLSLEQINAANNSTEAMYDERWQQLLGLNSITISSDRSQSFSLRP